MNRHAPRQQYDHAAVQYQTQQYQRQAAPVQYHTEQSYRRYTQPQPTVSHWAAQVQPAYDPRQRGASRQHYPRSRQASSGDHASRQPLSRAADVEQWEQLRRQGYVLRGQPIAPSEHDYRRAPPMQQQPSSISYAPSASSSWYPSHGASTHASLSRPPPLPSYNVHPHLRTASHPKTTPRPPQLANAFMKAPAPPTPPTHYAHSSPKRPPMKHRPSASSARTLRGAVQLRPDSIFVYERPSKASYYQPDPVYASPATIYQQPAQQQDFQSQDVYAGQWERKSTYTPSIRSTSSRPQTPCQIMNAQPAYPPTPDLDHHNNATVSPGSMQGVDVPAPRRRSADAASAAGSAISRKSRTLRRVETEQSCYSQQTYAEDYSHAMDARSLRRASTPAAAPLETAATDMSLGACQRLWHELEKELLAQDGAEAVDRGEAGYPEKALTKIEDTFEGSEYDFTGDLTPTQPLRPQLTRRKSSLYRYKGHERASDSLLDKARQATEASSPAAIPVKQNPVQRPHKESSASMKQVATLRSVLRRKTPANEVLESQAMRELKRQSAPSEADASEYGYQTSAQDEEEQQSYNGSEDGYAESRTDSDSLAAETVDEEQAAEEVPNGRDESVNKIEGGKKGEARVAELEQASRTLQMAKPAIAQLVKRQTRIPAPLARKYAGKLYASRERIVKA